jgi:aryl-alcohol dehydrogenase-like predicted oxidoreductase
VSSAIIGASRPEQLDETLAAVDQPIDPDIKAKLDEATVEYRFGDALR